jgi:hypothetical protein
MMPAPGWPPPRILGPADVNGYGAVTSERHRRMPAGRIMLPACLTGTVAAPPVSFPHRRNLGRLYPATSTGSCRPPFVMQQ